MPYLVLALVVFGAFLALRSFGQMYPRAARVFKALLWGYVALCVAGFAWFIVYLMWQPGESHMVPLGVAGAITWAAAALFWHHHGPKQAA